MADELIKPTPATSPAAPEVGAVDRTGRAQVRSAERLAAALALIAGFIDAYGMITYGVYVSFMSGNTTQTGYQAAEGAFGPASLSALAILFFVVGSFAGTLLVEFAGRYARRVLYCVVAAALAAIVGLTQLGMLPGALAIAAISVAMGVMNNALSRVGAHRKLEPRRIESRACPEARAPSRRAGAVGHSSAPGAAPGPTLGWIPGRRLFVWSRHAALRRAGAIGSGADPRYPRGARSSRCGIL